MKKLYLRDCEIGKTYVTMRGMYIKLLSKDRRPAKVKDMESGQETVQSGLLVQSLATEKTTIVRDDYPVIDIESPGEEDEIRARDVLGRFARYELELNDNVRKAALMLGLILEVDVGQKGHVVQPEVPIKVSATEVLSDETSEKVLEGGSVEEVVEEGTIVDDSYSQEAQEESDFNLEEPEEEELPPPPKSKPKERKPHPWRGVKTSMKFPMPKITKLIGKGKAAPKPTVVKSKPKKVAKKEPARTHTVGVATGRLSLREPNVRDVPRAIQHNGLTTNKEFIVDLLRYGVQTRESLAKALMKSGRTEHKDMKPVLILISVVLNTLRKKDGLRFEDLEKGQYHIIG